MKCSSRAPRSSGRSGGYRRVSSLVVIQAVTWLLLTLMIAVSPAAIARAEEAPTSGAPASAPTDQYVFSLGELASVRNGQVTLSFADGATETYLLTDETTIRTQNGDAQTVSDLTPGTMLVVITREDDTQAVTIVNSGPTGFHEAGPADIRGHENACAGCADGP